jgi:signal transduction histidine kinase
MLFSNEEQHKLKDLMRSNDDFAYFMTKSLDGCKNLSSQICHELRNPLTLIKSTSQLIESSNPEVQDIKYWEQLKEDIHELELLLEEFSTYNHSESVNRQSQNILLLLKSIVAGFQPAASQKDVDISLIIDDKDIPCYTLYSFDRIKIKQVVTNILKNALEATDKGDHIQVACSTEDSSNLLITIKNDGSPIPGDILPTIFTPFVTYKTNGSGLGLAISSNIITAHGGTLSASSTEEETSFYIRLPL